MPRTSHPADAPTLAWASSPPPIPANYGQPAPTVLGAGAAAWTGLSRRERRRLRRQARRQARWHEASAWRVRGVPLHVRFLRFVGNLFVGTSLATLLIIATAAGLFLALDIPGMMAAGIPDRDIPREMAREFGFSRWPQLLRGIGYVAAWVPIMMAAVVLIVSRRGSSGMHILRGVAGVGLFGLATVLLVQSTRHSRWVASPPTARDLLNLDARESALHEGHGGGLSIRASETELEVEASPARRDPFVFDHRNHRDDEERVSAAIEHYLEQVNGGLVVAATGAALLSLVMICWPAASRGKREDGGGGGKGGDASEQAPAAPAVAQA